MTSETIQFTAEETGAEAPVETSRPDNVPEKFWDAETKTINTDSLLQSYVELEKKLGQPQETQTEEPPDTSTPPATEPQDKNNSPDIAEDVQIDIEALQQHYNEKGSLPEADYATLESKGISRELVDEFIQHRISSAEQIRKSIFDSVGGEEAYSKICEWAGKALDDKQIKAYNEIMESGTPEQWHIAVDGLKAKYNRANGIRPQLMPPTGTSNGAARFESFQQLLDAQADPRYQKDPAFRDTVVRKLANSNI